MREIGCKTQKHPHGKRSSVKNELISYNVQELQNRSFYFAICLFFSIFAKYL